MYQKIQTPSTNDLQFRYYPIIEPSKPHFGCFSFKVQAASNAIISLSNNGEFAENTFSIVLGAYKNAKVVLRKKLSGHLLEKDAKNILSSEEFREFWIKWNPDGIIQVGRVDDQGEPIPILFYHEKYLYPINFIGLLTCCGVNGRWMFSEPSCLDFVSISTETYKKSFKHHGNFENSANLSENSIENFLTSNTTADYQIKSFNLTTFDSPEYQFFPVNDNCFKFSVQAPHDVNLILKDSTQSIEIIIGGWYNLKSGIIIRTPMGIQIAAQNDTEAVLDPNEFTEIWIQWYAGKLAVGKFSQNDEAWTLMVAENLANLNFNQIGLRTNGAIGNWIIGNCKCPDISNENEFEFFNNSFLSY